MKLCTQKEKCGKEKRKKKGGEILGYTFWARNFEKILLFWKRILEHIFSPE